MKLDLKQTTILMGMCSALGMCIPPEVQASNGEANSLIALQYNKQKRLQVISATLWVR